VSAPSRSLVIGTAGHIDHGKTTLVAALTGTDTDKLPEEKRRGITIELGFATWPLSDKLSASIVDVPGHEGFVRTMVAGAGGLDIVIFVISAEDGVMPQTREHIRVCQLLGLKHSVIALTKVDRLEGDEDAIELAIDDVREAMHETPFEGAPILPVAAPSGQGLDALRQAIISLAKKIPRRASKGESLLPIDRVFTVKGHGTVVTGTLLAGSIEPDKDISLRLVPTGARREGRVLRARALQVRGDAAGRSVAGTRTALNLGGVQVSELSRGDVITSGARVVASDSIHVEIKHLSHSSGEWKSGSCVQVCAGTANTAARMDPLALIDEEGKLGDVETGIIVGPGMSGLIRLRLDVPIPVWHGQPIVLRAFNDPSAAAHGLTVGGGRVVDPQPSTGKRQRKRWVQVAEALRSDELQTRILALVEDSGGMGIDTTTLHLRAGIDDLRPILNSLKGPKGRLLEIAGARYILRELLNPLKQAAVSLVDRFHAQHSMQPGMPRATLESSLPGRLAPSVAAAAIEATLASGQLRVADRQGSLARPGKGKLSLDALPPKMQRVYDLYAAGGISPPTLKDVQDGTSMSPKEILEIVGLLQRTELLVKVTAELSFTHPAHSSILARTRDHLRDQGNIDVQAMKAITGLSRKFVVPLLEHLDRLGITLRRADTRLPGPKAELETEPPSS